MSTLDGMTTGTWALDPAHTEVGSPSATPASPGSAASSAP